MPMLNACIAIPPTQEPDMRPSTNDLPHVAHRIASIRHAMAAVAMLGLLALCSTPAPAAEPPKAKSVPATDAYPGFEVVDPYRNLEQLDDPDTQAWMKAQADHARRVLDAMPGRARVRAALDDADAMLAFSSSDIRPATATRMFYRRREAGGATQKRLRPDGRGGPPRLRPR